MYAGVSNDVLKQSIHGIQEEIYRRTWRLETLKVCVTGDVRRFIKPVKDQARVIKLGLQVYREIQKLKKIRNSLRIILLWQTQNTKEKTLKRI